MKTSFALAAVRGFAVAATLTGCSSSALIPPFNPPARSWNNTWQQPTAVAETHLTPTDDPQVITLPISPITVEPAATELEFSYPPPISTLTRLRTEYAVDLGACARISPTTEIAPVYKWIRIQINPWLEPDRQCLTRVLSALPNQTLKVILAMPLPQVAGDSLGSVIQLRQFGAKLVDLLHLHANKIKAVELYASPSTSLTSLLNSLAFTYGLVKHLNPSIWVIAIVQRITFEKTSLSPAQLAAFWGYIDCVGLQILSEAHGTLDQRMVGVRSVASSKPVCVTVSGSIEQTQPFVTRRGIPLVLVVPSKTL
jgi:hypothetical protein